MSYFYGPVYSRRLGFSLGVDLFPEKTCSFDCVYCQLGPGKKKLIRRVSGVNIPELKQELKAIVSKKPRIDFITISGSGEPTLHKNLDKIIKAIKAVSRGKYPLCVITNSSLLYRNKVREELKPADVIIPSLDAITLKTFRNINKPHVGINPKKLLGGLIKLRREFKGKIWLEVMLVKGVNDSLSEAKKFREIIKRINPDKLQLNLPVRPSARGAKLPSPKRLKQIGKIIGSKVEVVSSFYDGRKKFTAK